ncbi:immunoglobulin superfamily member 6 [Dasypus novemcinctus]|uniref:immunoglobulin superfamily member 6 n=1 Tax=Dasypus novemcinctus TaxID=9361 RepID=UPI0039C952AF
METERRGKLLLGLEINVILLYVGAVGACTVSVSQPGKLEVNSIHEAVTIDCTFSIANCPEEQPTKLWFRFGAHQAENLCLDGCRSKAGKYTVTESLAKKQVSLTVNSVTLNDSAIYICGIAFPSKEISRAKQTGNGTTLVVREIKPLSKELQSFLIALLSLLSIYLIGVCVVFIILSKSKQNTPGNKETEEDSHKKKSARRIFQDIAQELYHKRYMETNQQPVYARDDSLPRPEDCILTV